MLRLTSAAPQLRAVVLATPSAFRAANTHHHHVDADDLLMCLLLGANQSFSFFLCVW